MPAGGSQFLDGYGFGTLVSTAMSRRSAVVMKSPGQTKNPPMDSTDIQTRRILFTGRVQGVGFRWTTKNLARSHPVTGFVRNLADGRVELVAQGTATAIDDLLSDIQSHLSDNITSTDSNEVESADEYTAFQIRR